MSLALNKPKLDNLAGDIWKSAERLRGKFKAYEYQNVVLPIIVIRRLECVLIKWREDKPEIVSVEWTHRHYVKDDEYIPHGDDIEAFLKREIAKPIIRWEDSPQLGYEILPNKYFYRYQPPTPAKDLLAEFWKLEKEAEEMLKRLAE
jgi:type I restriction-modification system DNA methylase subunit